MNGLLATTLLTLLVSRGFAEATDTVTNSEGNQERITRVEYRLNKGKLRWSIVQPQTLLVFFQSGRVEFLKCTPFERRLRGQRTATLYDYLTKDKKRKPYAVQRYVRAPSK